MAIQHHAMLWPCLAQSGVEWSSNAKCTKHMHGNMSPQPVSTNVTILVLFEKNAITTSLETCVHTPY